MISCGYDVCFCFPCSASLWRPVGAQWFSINQQPLLSQVCDFWWEDISITASGNRNSLHMYSLGTSDVVCLFFGCVFHLWSSFSIFFLNWRFWSSHFIYIFSHHTTSFPLKFVLILQHSVISPQHVCHNFPICLAITVESVIPLQSVIPLHYSLSYHYSTCHTITFLWLSYHYS